MDILCSLYITKLCAIHYTHYSGQEKSPIRSIWCRPRGICCNLAPILASPAVFCPPLPGIGENTWRRYIKDKWKNNYSGLR